MTLRTAVGAAVLLALFGACNGDDRGASVDARRSTTTTARDKEPGGGLVAVEVELERSYERPAVHVIRVEAPDGKQVFERTLGPSRRIEERLPPGQYRVLSFQRVCTRNCDVDRQPTEVGEPTDVCGSYFDVAATKSTRLKVVVVPDEGCSIEIS